MINFILYAILLGASVVDFKTLKIPNALTLFGMCSGLVVSFIEKGLYGLGQSFLALVLIFLFLFPLWALSAVGIPLFGAGDVKLLMVISSFLLVPQTVKILFFSLILGSLLFLVLIPPKKIISMFSDLFYLTFYSIPTIREEKLRKISFAFPIFLSTIFVSTFFM